MKLTVSCWKWGTLFEARHVNTLRSMLDRHLHLDHELVCVTDNGEDIDGDVRIVPIPTKYAATPRCRRRMQQYSRDFNEEIGSRILTIDLDVVIVDDLTPILDRNEPVVCWKVRHAGVFSGSCVLFDAGAVDEPWRRFAADPEGYPRQVQRGGIPSDQAMLNAFLKRGASIPYWTEADGFVTFYGKGYERLEHYGVGPNRRELPPGARIVVLGSADLAVLDDPTYPWVAEHYR